MNYPPQPQMMAREDSFYLGPIKNYQPQQPSDGFMQPQPQAMALDELKTPPTPPSPPDCDSPSSFGTHSSFGAVVPQDPLPEAYGEAASIQDAHQRLPRGHQAFVQVQGHHQPPVPHPHPHSHQHVPRAHQRPQRRGRDSHRRGIGHNTSKTRKEMGHLRGMSNSKRDTRT